MNIIHNIEELKQAIMYNVSYKQIKKILYNIRNSLETLTDIEKYNKIINIFGYEIIGSNEILTNDIKTKYIKKLNNILDEYELKE